MASYSTYNLAKIRNPELRAILEAIMDVTAGHDHDGTNSKAATAGTVADGAITTAKILDANVTLAKLAAAVQASLALADSALQPGEIELANGTPTNAAAASIVMTIDGVVIDGETVSIGDDVYEFCADAAQSLTAGSTIAVDITALVTAAQGKLTVAVNPINGDTMTIGDKLFTFVPLASANGDGDIGIGIDLAATKLNIVAAINGTDTFNTASEFVSAAAFDGNDCILTALVGGTSGNSIVTTETFDNEGNIFDAGMLGTTTAGVDCTKGDAKTAFIAAVTASDTQGVGATSGAGDTLTLAADAKGTAGNSIAIAETMAHGAFAGEAVALAGGSAGTVGAQWQTYVDANYLYIAIDTNTVNDANWRRVALGSAY